MQTNDLGAYSDSPGPMDRESYRYLVGRYRLYLGSSLTKSYTYL